MRRLIIICVGTALMFAGCASVLQKPFEVMKPCTDLKEVSPDEDVFQIYLKGREAHIKPPPKIEKPAPPAVETHPTPAAELKTEKPEVDVKPTTIKKVIKAVVKKPSLLERLEQMPSNCE